MQSFQRSTDERPNSRLKVLSILHLDPLQIWDEVIRPQVHTVAASISQGEHYINWFSFAYFLTFAWLAYSVILAESESVAQFVNYRLAMVSLLTQKVQFQALALRAADFDLLSSSDRVWGKSGFRSIPSSLSATSRNNLRCAPNCWASSSEREHTIGKFATRGECAIELCYNIG
jgi:hypothetical protein